MLIFFFFLIKEGAEHLQNSAPAHNNLTFDFRFKSVLKNYKLANEIFRTCKTGSQSHREYRIMSGQGGVVWDAEPLAGDILAGDPTSYI